MGSETSTADIGKYEEEIPLASVMMSGAMLTVSEPNMLPVRPKPQITSSAMTRIPNRFRTATIFSK